MRSSLVPHAVLLMRPRTMKCPFVILQHWQKAICKSRPGHLLPSTWYFWVVHECTFHLWTKTGLPVDVWIKSVFPDPVKLILNSNLDHDSYCIVTSQKSTYSQTPFIWAVWDPKMFIKQKYPKA